MSIRNRVGASYIIGTQIFVSLKLLNQNSYAGRKMGWGEKYEISFKIMRKSRDLEGSARGKGGCGGAGGADGGESSVVILVQGEDKFPG